MEGVGTHWHGNVDYVEVGNYSGGKPTGKGVLWNIHDKSVAWRLEDGKQGEQITKEEAEGIARSLEWPCRIKEASDTAEGGAF